jgi:hypothetical protein
VGSKNPGQRDGNASPRSLIALGDRLVFTACDGEQQRIYRTDGTPGALVALADGPESCWTYGPPVPPVALAGAVVVDARYSMVRVDEAGNAVTILDRGAEAMVPMGDALVLLGRHPPVPRSAGGSSRGVGRNERRGRHSLHPRARQASDRLMEE